MRKRGVHRKKPKVIVLAGIAGTNKMFVAEDFRDCIRRYGPDIDGQSVSIFLAEDPKLIDMPTFLGEDGPRAQGRMLERAYQEVGKAILAEKKKAAIHSILVPMHFSFMCADRVFSSLALVPSSSWLLPRELRPLSHNRKSLLLSFLAVIEPDYIINLIDDVSYAQSRQKLRNVNLKLHDIFKWRELEVLVADFASNEVIQTQNDSAEKHLYEYSPVVAVRHTCDMLYRYIFSPNTPRIYASFLISEWRKHTDDPVRAKLMKQQIDALICALDREFCLFNPMTIDELPLENLIDAETCENYPDIIKSTITANGRPILSSPTLTRDPVRAIMALSKSEISEIFETHPTDGLTVVDRQVRSRDIRLIDQSDAMVVYRPTNKLKPKNGTYWGGGCLEEFLYAQSMMSQRTEFRIYAILDETDHPIADKIGASSGSLKKSATRIRQYIAKQLDDPNNQKRIIEEVITQIKADAPSLVRSRVKLEISSR